MQRRAFLMAGTAALAIPGTAVAAPSADLWNRWTRHDPNGSGTVDHSAWSAFLGRHLAAGGDGINRFRYAAARNDMSALSGYLSALSATQVSLLNRTEQFAYWVNVYNAVTVKVILDHYPVASIRDIDISPGLFADGPWGAALFTVEGESLTLDDVEHRILRPIWRDPRVHYAVNCAALGCPNLQPAAFTAANTPSLLEAGARAFVNHPRGARVEGGDLHVSSIYEWFKEDFGGNDAGVIAHLRQYATGGLAAALAGISDIDDDSYDWSLNDAGSIG